MYVDQHVHGYAELLLPEWLHLERYGLYGCQHLFGGSDLFVPGWVHPVWLYLQPDLVAACDGDADLSKRIYVVERCLLDADYICGNCDVYLSRRLDFDGGSVPAIVLLYGECYLYVPSIFPS